MSKIYLYAAIGLLIAGLGWGLKHQLEKNGRLLAENQTLVASYELLNAQMLREQAAQEEARQGREQAERDAAIARREINDLKVRYAELFNLRLPAELIERLRHAIREANGDLPASKPVGEM